MNERTVDANEFAKRTRRFFAVASLGKKRWYWIVWPSLEELQGSEQTLLLIGEGCQENKAEAVESALELAGGNAEWIAAKYARAHHRNQARTRREGNIRRATAPSSAANVQEFLYRDVRETTTGHWRSLSHRVARKTSKYVFVQQQPYSPDDVTGSWLDQGLPTFRLDRQALEQEGYAFIPVSADLADAEEPVFFSTPYHERTRQHGHATTGCLETLGLSWPCAVAQVKVAYRNLAKTTHPDGGGSHDEFLALQAAYVEALEIFRSE